MKSAQWIISQAGLQSLMSAGVSTGWLKAWLLSAGVTEVSIDLLESNTWVNSNADWQLFFARPDELNEVAEKNFIDSQCTQLKLDNPPRHVCNFMNQQRQTLLIPIGEIAYQRHHWLSLLTDGKALSPLYVSANDKQPITLEPGLSAGLRKPEYTEYLNAAGITIEEQVIASLKRHKLSIRTVESCSAGGIAARLCRVSGASDVVDRSWVTYSNRAKQEEVGVDAELIDEFGAVSQDVVIAMADGGADASHICIATSGIAGPSGGTDKKPVGTVWVAIALEGQSALSRCFKLSGARHEIQARAVIESLHLLLNKMGQLRL